MRALILLVIFSMATGQILFKIVANNLQGVEITSSAGVWRALAEPLLWPALILYGLTTVLWVAVLREENLSRAYPVVIASSILIVSLAGVLFFHESLKPIGFVGIILILAGLLVTASSG